MAKDLTKSAIDRQNILNNPEIIQKIQDYFGISGMDYNGQFCFTTAQIADFFGVSTKTIKRYVNNSEKELEHNGYCVLKGKKLKEFKTLFSHLIYKDIEDNSQGDIDVPLSSDLTDKQKLSRLKALAIFNFRTLLNIGMLLTESDRARVLRSAILDIVIENLNSKLGGSAKFINQRDDEYLIAKLREPKYRKEFTDALRDYLDMGDFKYSLYTDTIYQAIFRENAKEYKEVLKLEEAENPRETMYAEILKLIASFEIGIADEIKKHAEKIGRKLKPFELDGIIEDFSKQRFWQPQLEDARVKMSTRDYGFREVVHKKLEAYIDSISASDYQKFLGDQSKSLQERIDQNIETFKRLKER
jgi:hypothetical protein